jgi:alkylation response protein AidB-like acyl-CoA dehydrogenase
VRWELEEEQELFQESLRGWLEKFADTRAVREWLDSGDSTDFERRLADDGWLGVGTSEERGGQGGGLLELALTAEELARRAAPSAAWLASMIALPALPDFLAKAVVEGEDRLALAVDCSRPIAVPDGVRAAGDGALHGSVPMVLGADRASRLVVAAQGASGPELHLVDTTDAAVVVTAHQLLDRSRSVADVVLDGAVGRRLDGLPEIDGFIAEAGIRAAVLVSADALGAMQRMLDLAVAHSLQRQQFGVPIGSFQAVKHAAASILVAVEAARSIVYFAAASVDSGEPDRAVDAAIAKAQVTPSAVRAADTALTMHGAIGYTWEHDLQLLYKRAKLDDRLFGRAAAWNERIADALELVPKPVHAY